MTSGASAEQPALAGGWQQRAAEQSPSVQRSRVRSAQRAQDIVVAAQRLIARKGSSFTTQELAKESGVALQTFYAHFGSKDQVLLAVLEEMVARASVELKEAGRALPDPLSRLHLYITSLVKVRSINEDNWAGFVTDERWRLHKRYPDDLSRAMQPVVDLLASEIQAAAQAGVLRPLDPEHDAWLLSQLVSAVFHHQQHVSSDEPFDDIAERVWLFCLGALGGSPATWSPLPTSAPPPSQKV